MLDINKPFFSVSDVSYILGVHRLTVLKLIKVGQLKAQMKSKRDGYKITSEDFKEYCKMKNLDFEKLLQLDDDDIVAHKDKISPQDNNSILGYPPHPYNPGYTHPNLFFDATYSPSNKDKNSYSHKGPKDDKNPHNSLYTLGEIGEVFGVDPISLTSLLERLGYIYRIGEFYNATAPLIRFGLVKPDIAQKALYWTYIGRRFLEDQLMYEIGFEYANSSKNRELVSRLLRI